MKDLIIKFLQDVIGIAIGLFIAKWLGWLQ